MYTESGNFNNYLWYITPETNLLSPLFDEFDEIQNRTCPKASSLPDELWYGFYQNRLKSTLKYFVYRRHCERLFRQTVTERIAVHNVRPRNTVLASFTN
jgi:hypothetical protein